MTPFKLKPTAAVGCAVVITSLLGACGGSGTEIAAPQLQVLSSKPEYVTGGDALIDVSVPQGAQALLLKVNGKDVASSLKTDAVTGHMVGMIAGLAAGDNTIEASFGGAAGSLKVTNYAITGPFLSGPQISPFACQTQQFLLPDGSNLGTALDANCSAATRVLYVYRSTAGGALKPMADTTKLPADVASTTTTAGATVPFVVRIETGTMNRGIYQNAVLHDPTSDAAPSPATPPKGWNKKLIAVHGTGCTGGWYAQGSAMGVSPYTGVNLTRLGEGYGVFTNTLNHPTISCNAVVAGETTLMGKERFTETFGVPKSTVSVGTSGGAYTSLQVADAYPGVFDGVFIDATFPDALSISLSALDDKLLNHYLTGAGAATVTETQMVKVSGHKSPRAWYDLALQSGRTDPTPGRIETIPVSGFATPYASSVFAAAVPTNVRYNASTNPTGARATVFDVGRNVYGRDANGFGLRPYDNIGVQYGLAQLNDGTLTPAQFLDLNEKVGGYDNEGNYTAGRTAGDAGAIKRAYQAGLQLSGGGGLAAIPVFDSSNFYDEDNFYHYQWFHFAVRERMLKANGDTRNHVMWRGGVTFGDLFAPATANAARAAINAKVATDGWTTFVSWVDAYKADTSTVSQKEKVVARKPAAAVDGCFTATTPPVFKAETQTLAQSGAAGTCNDLWPSWTFPRFQAGTSVAADVIKCQLKPVATADYKVTFSAAEQSRLGAIFPAGVCDWGKSGVNQTAVVPYASFGPSSVNQVFDVLKP